MNTTHARNMILAAAILAPAAMALGQGEVRVNGGSPAVAGGYGPAGPGGAVAASPVVYGRLARPAEIPPEQAVEGAQPAPPSVSFIDVAPGIPRKYKKHDLLTVVVRQDSNSTSTGKAKNEKKQDFDLALQQMVQLNSSGSGLPFLTTVDNPSKLPEIKFKYDNNRENNASQQRTDSITFRIQAEVVDVKPNGTMVIEAKSHINQDGEEQLFKLTGTCRVADIAPDNTILSTQLADLNLAKETIGEVKDGTRRGWLNKVLDAVNPF